MHAEEMTFDYHFHFKLNWTRYIAYMHARHPWKFTVIFKLKWGINIEFDVKFI